MKNFIKRSLSGIVFIAIVIGSILLGVHVFASVFLVITIIGLHEYAKFSNDTFQHQSTKLTFLFSGILLYILIGLVHLEYLPIFWITLFIPILIIPVILVLLSDYKNPLASISNMVFGLIYIAIPFALLISFHKMNSAFSEFPELIIGFFVILWFNDVFAYIIGSLIGKTKLYEKISPNKTWEGTIGGIILSMCAAFGLSLFFSSIGLTDWLVIGLLISIFATLGDLVESMFKRHANLKDSGNIMPGHGGVLDRFDGLLLAAPVVYVYMNLVS